MPALVVGLLASLLTGCEQPASPSLVVATSWPLGERLRIESEFQQWQASSKLAAGHESIRVQWLLLMAGDPIEPVAHRRSASDVLLGGRALALDRLSAEGRLLPVDALDSARWCVCRQAAGDQAGRGDPRTDSLALSWAENDLEPGRWREGYAARLVDVAGHSPRIGPRAGLEPTGRRNGDLVFSPGLPLAEGVAILAATRNPELARTFVRFLLETRIAELHPSDRTPGFGSEPDFDSLVADLLGATLVDGQDELWAAWEALERTGSPGPALKWLTEPPPWPPASIEKYLKREGEHAMSLIETLVGELSPRPAVLRMAYPELAAPPRVVDDTLLAELTRAADGALIHEPRFRAWLRAEWTASARQRYRRVAKLATTSPAGPAAH